MLQLRMEQKVKIFSLLTVLQRILYLLFSVAFYFAVWNDIYITLLAAMTYSYVVVTIIAIFAEMRQCK